MRCIHPPTIERAIHRSLRSRIRTTISHTNILSTEPTVTRKVVPSLCKGGDTNRIRILSKGREKWREIIYAVLSHARDTRRGWRAQPGNKCSSLCKGVNLASTKISPFPTSLYLSLSLFLSHSVASLPIDRVLAPRTIDANRPRLTRFMFVHKNVLSPVYSFDCLANVRGILAILNAIFNKSRLSTEWLPFIPDLLRVPVKLWKMFPRQRIFFSFALFYFVRFVFTSTKKEKN